MNFINKTEYLSTLYLQSDKVQFFLELLSRAEYVEY